MAPESQCGNQDIGIITAGGAPNTPGTLVVTVNSNDESCGAFRIGAVMADNGSGPLTFVKAGQGNIKIDGHNTFTGGSYLLQGRVQMTGTEKWHRQPDRPWHWHHQISPGAYLFPGTFTMTNNFVIAGHWYQ